MSNRPTSEDGDICGSTTNVNDTDTEITLILGKNRVTRRKLFKNDVVNYQPSALDTLFYVLHGIYSTGHHMHFCFEPHP